MPTLSQVGFQMLATKVMTDTVGARGSAGTRTRRCYQSSISVLQGFRTYNSTFQKDEWREEWGTPGVLGIPELRRRRVKACALASVFTESAMHAPLEQISWKDYGDHLPPPTTAICRGSDPRFPTQQSLGQTSCLPFCAELTLHAWWPLSCLVSSRQVQSPGTSWLCIQFIFCYLENWAGDPRKSLAALFSWLEGKLLPKNHSPRWRVFAFHFFLCIEGELAHFNK